MPSGAIVTNNYLFVILTYDRKFTFTYQSSVVNLYQVWVIGNW